MTLRLTPEVVLMSDSLMSRVHWTLKLETDRIATLAAENDEIATLLAVNGWTPRMLAWQHLIHGWLDQLGFDDENGRCG